MTLCSLSLAARGFSVCYPLTFLLQPILSQWMVQKCPAVLESQSTKFPAMMEGRFYCFKSGHGVSSEVKSNLHIKQIKLFFI